ncbi:MAG: PAS domain S-box protein [Leptospiraceae bacterium]|nr:PAS domain S-box protein [Leptospiraceae bacterium]MCP5495338.1 PAS domain S-box protein [Leptospiraceae bacterium]
MAITAFVIKNNRVAFQFGLLMSIFSVWGVFKIFTFFIHSLEIQIFIFNTVRAVTIFTPGIVLLIIINYLKQKVGFIKFLLFVAVLLSILSFIENFNNHSDYNYEIAYINTIPVLRFEPSLLSAVYIIYLYFCLISTIIIIIYNLFHSSLYFKRQLFYILIAIAIPAFNDLLFRFNISPIPGHHLTPECFAIGNYFFAKALFEYNFLKIIPITRKIVMDSLEDIIITVDPNNIVIDVNQSCESIFGFNINDINGKQFESTFKNYEELIYIYKTSKSKEIVIKTNKGFHHFFVKLSKVLDKKNKELATVIILQNITEIKQAELKLKKYSEELEKINFTKDRFFSIISHDLRNPFNALIGISDLLLEKVENTQDMELKEFATLINEASLKAYKLLENLLEWSRIQTGTIKLEPMFIKVKDVINESIETVGLSSIKKSITMTNEIEDTSIYADYNMVLTILRNLISNAIKFTNRNGKIIICSKILKEQNKVQINIVDSGVGISEEDITKIFSIDQKNSKPGTDKEIGTGLGLILCKEFVQINKGEIFISSKLNEGTTVSFTMPMARIEN